MTSYFRDDIQFWPVPCILSEKSQNAAKARNAAHDGKAGNAAKGRNPAKAVTLYFISLLPSKSFWVILTSISSTFWNY